MSAHQAIQRAVKKTPQAAHRMRFTGGERLTLEVVKKTPQAAHRIPAAESLGLNEGRSDRALVMSPRGEQ